MPTPQPEFDVKEVNAAYLRRLLATRHPVAIMARKHGQTYRVRLYIADDTGRIVDITALVGQERTKRPNAYDWYIPLKASTLQTVASLPTIVTGYWLYPYANGQRIEYSEI